MPNQQIFQNPGAERNCRVITKHRGSKDGTGFVYRTDCGSSLQLRFLPFSTQNHPLPLQAPAVTYLCACDQTCF